MHTGILLSLCAEPLDVLPDSLRRQAMTDGVNMGFPCWGVTQLERKRQETLLMASLSLSLSIVYFTPVQLLSLFFFFLTLHNHFSLLIGH